MFVFIISYITLFKNNTFKIESFLSFSHVHVQIWGIPLSIISSKRMPVEIRPLFETAVIALAVSIPIFIIRKLRWVSSSTSRKLLHICILYFDYSQ